MCDESKKTDKEISEETKVETREEIKAETREETSKPRKGYFLYGVKVGFVVGITNIVLLILISFDKSFNILFNPYPALMVIYCFLLLSCIFLIYTVFKYRTQGVKNILKIIVGIIVGMIIIFIISHVYSLSMHEAGPL